jgi:hypothetical protein
VAKDSLVEEHDLLATMTGVPQSETSHFRPDIQGLRALADILVILVHASVSGLEGGYVGGGIFKKSCVSDFEPSLEGLTPKSWREPFGKSRGPEAITN